MQYTFFEECNFLIGVMQKTGCFFAISTLFSSFLQESIVGFHIDRLWDAYFASFRFVRFAQLND